LLNNSKKDSADNCCLCQEEHGEPVNIKRGSELRNEILNETRMMEEEVYCCGDQHVTPPLNLYATS